MREIGLFIDGTIESAGDRDFLETFNPATEVALGRTPIATAGDVDRAVSAARVAFDGGWSGLSAARRADYLYAIADGIERRLESIARLETADTGMTFAMTRGGHIPRSIAHFRYFADACARLSGESIPLDGNYLSLVHREPLGVVAVVAPWNAPLAVASINIAAILAAGNTCVLKPSERSPLSASILAEIACEVGLPPGALNIVYGPGQPSGEALISHPGVDGISFIGGTANGKQILRTAADGVKRVTLELGGKSPTIILGDCDLERALDGALLSVFASNGEVCTAGSRILVERSVYAEFVGRFAARAERIRIGDPMAPETEMGPLIDRTHFDRVSEFVARGVQEGAKLVVRGGRPAHLPKGHYYSPSVFADVVNRMSIAREEIFGPVACIIPVDDLEHAVTVANDTDFGLAASIWAGNTSRALSIARRIRAGVVAVNSPIVRDIRAPFGGMKQSGLGRVGGRWSIESWTEVKTTCLPIDGYELPRLGA